MYKDNSIEVPKKLEEEMLNIVEQNDNQKPWDVVEKLLKENPSVTEEEARKVLKKISLDKKIRFSSKGYIRKNSQL